MDAYYSRRNNSCSNFLSFQLMAINEGTNMRVILLSLMTVFLFGYHANTCIVPPCNGPMDNSCTGNAEIRFEFNGTVAVQWWVNVYEGEDLPKKASKLKYWMTGGRNAEEHNVTIEVEGNCCWKFYQR